MLAAVILVVVALAQDPSPDKPPTPATEAGKRSKPRAGDGLEPEDAFEGTWKLISVRDDGESRPTDEAWLKVSDGRWREVNASNSESIRWRVQRRADEPWPRVERMKTIPRGIGMILQGQRGIYRLSDDTLTFAFGLAEGPPPENFEPAPIGTVEVWQRVRDGYKFEDEFEGTWELAAVSVNGEDQPTNEARLEVSGSNTRWGVSWREVNPREEKPIAWVVRRRPAEPWPLVERRRFLALGVENAGRKNRGIYRLSDDTLTFAFGPEKGPPPSGFEPGFGRTVEVWKRVSAEPLP